MSEPLRVLQVVTKMDRGGLETFIMNVYRNINLSKIQFDFLCHRKGEYAYDAEINKLGGHIYHVSRCNPLSLSYMKEIDSFFFEHRYKIVHSHIDCMSALPLAAAKKHGAVLRIAHSHSSLQDKDFKYPLKLICKHYIKEVATDMFACGIESGKWMFGTDNFTVIRNAIDARAYAFSEIRRSFMRNEFGVTAGTLVVGHIGRFQSVKNHVFILKVFAELLKIHSDAILLLVGDGELRLKTEKMANRLGIERAVRFMGVRPDVPDLMQSMDVFLMPSIYEGLPLVLVEAQAAGLPCLISKNIPLDCECGQGGLERRSLSDSPKDWAFSLLSIYKRKSDRFDRSAVIQNAEFDIKRTAAMLQSFYLSV